MSVYIVPESERPRFEFEVEGKRYSIPYLRHLPMARIRDWMKAGESNDGKLAFFADVFEEFAPGVTNALDAEQFVKLTDAWADQGAKLGESQASSD